MTTFEEIIKRAEGLGLPIARNQFTATNKKPVPDPPFLVYLSTERQRGDDTKNRIREIEGSLELYTERKADLDLEKQIEENPGFAAYFVDHTAGVYPTSASGSPWNAASIGVKGDTIADLNEDLAAEQKARVTYDNILRMVDDPDIIQPIKFLREREIVHYQRFGEGLRVATDKLNSKNYYMTNPSFDQ